MEKTITSSRAKKKKSTERVTKRASARPAKHNTGKAILTSLEAIKEGNVIVVKQDRLKEDIKKLFE